jgi:SAM-dependent methyltransferase
MRTPETLEEVHRQAVARLYPSITNPNWLVLRRRRQIFQQWLLQEKNDLDVLDVGGRIQTYRALFQDRLRSYVAMDLRSAPLVNAVARAEQIPFASNQFDLVICTQVLEYIPDPRIVMAEIRRVLKPGGRLLLSIPAVFPRDADQDTWRFLPQSIKILLADFAQMEIAPEGTSITGFFRTICVCLQMFIRPAIVRNVSKFTLVPLLNVTGICLESLFPNTNDQFTANYSVLARK